MTFIGSTSAPNGMALNMNLLFDLDGTLTDPFLGISRCIAYAFERLSRQMPIQENLRKYIGPPLRESFATLLSTDDPLLIEKALAFYRERYSDIGLYENDVYTDIPEALEVLQAQGHTLYVATSKPELYAKRIIDHFNLQHYFKNIYGCELDGTRGDKTSLIAYILQTEAIEPSGTLMVGDREHDMIGANENDVRSVGVLWGYGDVDELEASGAHAIIKAPRDLVMGVNSVQTPFKV